MSDDSLPGQFPYTRGIYPDMYRSRLWTMRQYAGFGTAEESNRRYRYLLSQGITGLSVAFDLPTQMGMDSDHPLAAGEVGRVGVAICSLADMQRLFDGIQLARDHHVDDHQFHGGDSAELLRAGGAQPGRRPAQALRHHPERHPEGIHRARHLHLSAAPGHAHHHRPVRLGRRASCRNGTPSRSAAITFAKPAPPRFRKWPSRWPTPSPMSEAAIDAGLDVDSFAPRLSFFFNAHNNFLEEIAKFRAARRLYATHHARPLRRARIRAR